MMDSWAETNQLVIMYPHIANTGYNHTGPGAYNHSIGDTCWDAYGKTGPMYDTKNGPQMRAVAAMIEAVSGVSM